MAFSKPLVTSRPGSSLANDITVGAGVVVSTVVVVTVVAIPADGGKEEREALPVPRVFIHVSFTALTCYCGRQ
jgi:hypothetical protein